MSGTRLKSPLLANQTAVYAHMSRAHKDAVTDVLVIESPFRCIVAADRSGCIRVWEYHTGSKGHCMQLTLGLQITYNGLCAMIQGSGSVP